LSYDNLEGSKQFFLEVEVLQSERKEKRILCLKNSVKKTDAVVRTRQLVASFEQKLILKRLSEIQGKISRLTSTKAERLERDRTFE
jgi:hypothetical protein